MGEVLSVRGMMRRGSLAPKEWTVILVCAESGVAAQLEKEVLGPGDLRIMVDDTIQGMIALRGESAEATGIYSETVLRVLGKQGIRAVWLEELDGMDLFCCHRKFGNSSGE